MVAGPAKVLADWLHELGEILYFHQNENIDDIIILKPQWVTTYISMVLESNEVIGSLGIFTKQHMEVLWPDLAPYMRDHFLRLMEQFDLSYRTLENKEISLVVERLSQDEADFHEAWQKIEAKPGSTEISMAFHLSTILAGIPTGFIARSHRFTPAPTGATAPCLPTMKISNIWGYFAWSQKTP